jgi:hypothetical protein
MALYLHPFISMPNPRAHKLARVRKMNQEQRTKIKSVRMNGEEPPKQPTRDVYIIT